MPSSRPKIHLDDQLSLAEFVKLWWAADVPAIDSGSLRMLRRNWAGFPTPSGSVGRTQLYRLGDLVSWIVRTDGSTDGVSPALEERSVRVSPLWHFRRAVDACRGELDAESSRRLAAAVLDVMAGRGGQQASRR